MKAFIVAAAVACIAATLQSGADAFRLSKVSPAPPAAINGKPVTPAAASSGVPAGVESPPSHPMFGSGLVVGAGAREKKL